MISDYQRRSRRVIAIVLALAASAALVVAAFGPRWLMDPDATGIFSFSLLSLEDCTRDSCQNAISNFELIDAINADIDRIEEENKTRPPNKQRPVPKRPYSVWAPAGLITFVACLLASLGLLIAAGLALARKRPELPIMPTTIAVLGLAIGIIAGCVFVATKPGPRLMGVGWSFIVFGAGAIAGLASVFTINRQIRPIDEELGPAAATMSWGGSRDDLP